MIIYNVVERLVGSEYNGIHSAYYKMDDAEKVINRLRHVDKGHVFDIEESCLHEPSEIPDLLKQLN